MRNPWGKLGNVPLMVSCIVLMLVIALILIFKIVR